MLILNVNSNYLTIDVLLLSYEELYIWFCKNGIKIQVYILRLRAETNIQTL